MHKKKIAFFEAFKHFAAVWKQESWYLILK